MRFKFFVNHFAPLSSGEEKQFVYHGKQQQQQRDNVFLRPIDFFFRIAKRDEVYLRDIVKENLNLHILTMLGPIFFHLTRKFRLKF